MGANEWRVERVRGIPNGAKLIIDEPEGEVGIVWVNEDELDGGFADLLAERLTEFSRAAVVVPVLRTVFSLVRRRVGDTEAP